MNEFYVKNISGYAAKIKEYLSGEEFRALFEKINGRYLYENYFDYFLDHTLGGKCLRGYLVYLFERLFNGKCDKKTLIAASAFEVFESAVLMHDDVIDRSEIRRGKPSAFIALGNNHTGKSRAICLGDSGLITAVSMLDRTENSKIRQYVTHIFLRTISGELADIDVVEKREICDNDVIAAFIEKTATYTVLGPSICGALLAGQTTEQAELLLTEFSVNAGVAFQIKDDLLGIYGNEKIIGKTVNGDIAEGKKSLLVSHFDRVADDKTKRLFYAHYGKGKTSENDAQIIRRLFEENGCRTYAEQKMREYFAKAKNEILALSAKIRTDENALNELLLFIEFLENRQK